MKKFFKNNYKEILILIVIAIIINYPLPYYIFTGGGTTSIENKFIVEDATKSEGSYRFSYVREIKATPMIYLLAQIIPEWDAVPIKDYQYDNTESINDLLKRDKLLLEEANNRAAFVAYERAGKEFEIVSNKLFIVATPSLKSDVPIKIGDQVVKVEKKEFTNFSDLLELINERNVGETIEFELLRDDKTYISNVEVRQENDRKVLGIVSSNIFDYKATPNIRFDFDNKESGPSGGFMLSLAIYDSLIEEDLTKGLKIVGTGEIYPNGKVGMIGGIKYKLVGAVKDKADVFFAPAGANYEEAVKLKEKHNYKIDVVSVDTIDDAINYLRGIDFKE